MKKIGLIFILTLITAFCLISVVQAEDNIAQTPNVKIVIDGQITSYKDVPLSINQRTLLPLRELLVNLGVENDDEHIIWNGLEKSVTVYKDNTKIYLKLDSKTVFVNDQPIEMDVAPIGYTNQRVYIPARFVSEALGKKIVWDGSSKAVLIRDIEDFNQVRDIIEKSDSAMDAVSRCKFDMDVDADIGNEGFNMNMGINMSGEVDNESKRMHLLMSMDLLGMNMSFDTYSCDNAIYTENPMTGEWEKTEMTQVDYDNMFSSNSNVDVFDATDAICAGLVISESDRPDEIVLKGNVYLDEFFDQASKQFGSNNESGSISPDYSFDEFYVEMSVDSSTYLLKSLTMNVKGKTYGDENVSTQIPVDMNMNINMDMNIKALYSDYNGDFEVVVPQEVIDSTIESVETVVPNT